jgi:predicted deacetylase
MKKEGFWFYLLIIFGFILFLGVFVILYRNFSPKELDDVTPGIECEKELMDKTQVYYVIPLFENKSIADNKTWCDYIRSLNKTLEMHGVYHTYNEFYTQRDEDYVNLGIAEFEKCFGFKPERFKAPQLALSSGNKKVLRAIGLNIEGNPSGLFHKAYHCSDTGAYSNKFIDWI